MANPENNPRIYPVDKTLPDDVGQELAEKTAAETILEPKMPDEGDENASDGKESKRIDPESKYPKASFSAWFKHLEGMSLCNEESKKQIASACLDPHVFPSCVASAEMGWNFIRHGIDDYPDEQKITDDKITLCWQKSIEIGDVYMKGGSVLPSTIKSELELVREIWREIFGTMNKLGLSFRFRKEDEDVIMLRRRLKEDPLRKNLVKAKGDDLIPITKPMV